MLCFVLNSTPAPEALREAVGASFRWQGPRFSRDRLTYLDTFDGALLRRGCSLAVRREGRRTALILAGPTPHPLHLRMAASPAFAWDLPAGLFRQTLSRLVNVRRLFPQVEVHARVLGWDLLNPDDKTVARLVLRQGSARLPPEPPRRARPLPPLLLVTPLKGYEDEAADAAEALRRTFGLEACPRGEAELALEAVGKVPWPYSSALDLTLDPETPAHLAVRQILLRLFRILQANEEGILQDWDTEFLHDYRVALRRTRSAVGQLKGVFSQGEIRPFQGELRWLADATGPLRDLDVYLLHLAGYREELPPEADRALEPLARLLRARRQEAYRALARTLRSRRYRLFREGWASFLEKTHEGVGEQGHLPISRVAGRRIRKAMKRVLAAGESVSDASPPEELHRLRIACKKLRYLLTFFQSLYPGPLVSPLERQLRKLQDTLGTYHDLVGQAAALEESARELVGRGQAPPETLLAMGRLVGQLETRQVLERKAFRKRFRAFARHPSRKSFLELLDLEVEGLRPPP